MKDGQPPAERISQVARKEESRMGHQGQTEEPRTNRVTRSWGGWTPSRGIWAGVAAAGIFSLIVIAAGVLEPGGDNAAGESA
ncbi:MAG TPA: hypothetical protein VFP63_09350, partial [Dehalococcoidia bacterium]|nr:hypothetical protein [Dehalococcoidia bacterium]